MIHIGAQLRSVVLHGIVRAVVIAVVPGALAVAGAVWFIQRRETAAAMATGRVAR